MAFEIRLIDQGPVYGGGDLVAGRFTDEEWGNLLSLAHECGFDPDREHAPVLYPEEVGRSNELDNKLTSGLYISVNLILNQDTLPFATTWETDDDRLHFRWAGTPGYARDFESENGRGFSRDFALNRTELQRFREYLGKGLMLVARTEDPETP